MSEVSENSGIAPLTAGNTVETLAPVDRDATAVLPSDADLDATVTNALADFAATVATESPVSGTVEEILDEENTFDVNRAEFGELRDLVLSIAYAIQKFNEGAPHKIPVLNINKVLGLS